MPTTPWGMINIKWTCTYMCTCSNSWLSIQVHACTLPNMCIHVPTSACTTTCVHKSLPQSISAILTSSCEWAHIWNVPCWTSQTIHKTTTQNVRRENVGTMETVANILSLWSWPYTNSHPIITIPQTVHTIFLGRQKILSLWDFASVDSVGAAIYNSPGHEVGDWWRRWRLWRFCWRRRRCVWEWEGSRISASPVATMAVGERSHAVLGGRGGRHAWR